MSLICERFEATEHNVRGPLRDRVYMLPRIAFSEVATLQGWKLRDIGRYLGGRDHSTIVNQRGRHSEIMEREHPCPMERIYRVAFLDVCEKLEDALMPRAHSGGMAAARARAVKMLYYVFPGTSYDEGLLISDC